MSDKDAEVIRAMAGCDMNMAEASRALFMHRNNVVYHVNKIRNETGLDPRRFCDLVELLEIAEKEDRNE